MDISKSVNDLGELLSASHGSFADLIILVKFKDNADDLMKWVDHHQKIVGYANLVIIDNNSVDPNIFSCLADLLLRGVKCYRYGGFHNDYEGHVYLVLLI